MDIQFYNSMGNGLQTFEPVTPGKVAMYNCGPTVYDYAHIGNFRSFLFADLLRRFLEFAGYDVHQVMNLTDVGHMTEDQLADGGGEDKMQVAAERLKEAKKSGKAPVDNPDDPYQVAAYYAEAFLEDANLLNLKVAQEYPHNVPSATKYVKHMIGLIEKLVANGHAYVAADSAVYFDVQSFDEYGSLSGNTIDKLRSGAGGRVEEGDQSVKKHPADFLLWKPDEKHIMKWDSPWGTGYPGWHIECSAMSLSTLEVDTLDIHTGGEDNIFPHHDCEIAQSQCATGHDYCKYWMHARHLFVEGEKMSKSKGNFYTLRDLMAKGIAPEVIRFELISAHYRSNMNFTLKGLADRQKQIERLRQFAATHPEVTGEEAELRSTEIEKAFGAALANDLNIAGALGELFKWMNAIDEPTAEDVSALHRMDMVLGVLEEKVLPDSLATEGLSDAEIDELCAKIVKARAARDFATSDAIRDQLIEAGIELRMGKDSCEWKRKIVANS